MNLSPPTLPSAASNVKDRVQVNIAACGTFHYRHYVRYLSASGFLKRFYYSHKRSTDAGELGIDPAQAVNLFAKEYLTHAHIRLLNTRLGNLAFPAYQRIWEWQAIRNWTPCDIAHVLIHGAAARLISHAKSHGALIIGEPVNAHPRFVQSLMREEYERLGLPTKNVSILNHGQQTMMAEVELVDTLLAPSKFVANSYINQGFDPSRVIVEPYETDLSRFHPGERADDGFFRVICVSQISPRKGHMDLIAAWEMLNLPRAELVFVGSMTPEMESLLASKRHLFTYRGRVPHAQLTKEFHQADVAVLPSIEDGFSYVPLEAMACGLPVIVSSNAGVSELVREGETGFVVPARSPEHIAKGIEALYKSASLRNAMGRQAADHMRQRAGWKDYSTRLMHRYTSHAKRHFSTIHS